MWCIRQSGKLGLVTSLCYSALRCPSNLHQSITKSIRLLASVRTYCTTPTLCHVQAQECLALDRVSTYYKRAEAQSKKELCPSPSRQQMEKSSPIQIRLFAVIKSRCHGIKFTSFPWEQMTWERENVFWQADTMANLAARGCH